MSDTTEYSLPWPKIACPFVYANGKACTGQIIRIEGYKADVGWERDSKTGNWSFGASPRSHYHLFCSEKGNHSGYAREDHPSMKLYYDQLPATVREIMSAPATPPKDRA